MANRSKHKPVVCNVPVVCCNMCVFASFLCGPFIDHIVDDRPIYIFADFCRIKMSISPLITTDTFLDLLRQCVEKMILHKEEVFPKKATLAQLEWKAI